MDVQRVADDLERTAHLRRLSELKTKIITERRHSFGRRQPDDFKWEGNLSFPAFKVIWSCLYKGERLWALALSLFIPALLMILVGFFLLFHMSDLNVMFEKLSGLVRGIVR